MELNEKELENILGGANPNVIKDNVSKDDELNDEQLENIQAGIYKREIADDIAQKNADLYRAEMIQRLKEERDRLVEEKSSIKK